MILLMKKKQRWITLVIATLLVGPAASQLGRAPPPPDYGLGPPRIDLKMAIVMVLLVTVFFILGFLSVYTRQCAQERFRARLDLGFEVGAGTETHNRGLDPDVIETFPAFLYSAVKGLKIGKGSLECAVCLSEFEDSETLRLIPKCDHVFHRDCIDAWLVSHSTCPVCRANLVPKPGEPTLALFVVPNIQSEPEPEPEAEPEPKPEPARAPRSWSTGISLGWAGPSGEGVIPRSRSVGHLPVGPGESLERFTLRLPGEVRSQLVGATLPRVASTRRGFRIGSVRRKDGSVYERFDPDSVPVPDSRWVFSAVPPFVSRSAGSSSHGNHDRDDLRRSDQC